MRVTILGCGGSDGVPLIGGADGRGEWGACDPAEPRNRRTRAAILVEQGETALLVDAGPDLKGQLLSARCTRISSVLFTHAHADHSHGIHELRRLARLAGGPLDAWGNVATLRDLENRFDYAFRQGAGSPYPPFLSAHVLDPSARDAVKIGTITVKAFQQDHGFGQTTLGFRFGPVAYTTDATDLEDHAFEILAGVDTWIVDCQQRRPHPTHAHLEKCLAWIARVAPRRAVLTHMGPDLDYRTLARECPRGIEPAYDGMVLDVDAI